MALEETFEKVRGMYLDRGTSLFETLATISAEEASRPVSASCASIAAHVAHLVLYMDVTLKFVRGEQIEVDWSEIWRTVQAVTPEEWEASQQELRSAYGKMQALARDTTQWGTNEIEGTPSFRSCGMNTNRAQSCLLSRAPFCWAASSILSSLRWAASTPILT